MKKRCFIALSFAVLMLAGCANGEDLTTSETETDSTLSSSVLSDNTSSDRISGEGSVSESDRLSDEEIISEFNGELTLPDKSVFPNSDIVGITEDPLSDDIKAFLTENGIMSFAAPVFFDGGTDEYKNYAPQEKETELGTTKTQYTDSDREHFVVHKGDVLDNGLTVESAKTGFYIGDGNFGFTQVNLKGELTLNGILMPYVHELGEKGHLENKKYVFIPDSTQNGSIPSVYDPEAVCKTIVLGEKEIVYDGTEFYLTAEEDYSELFNDEEYLENVSVTISDVFLAFYYTIGYGTVSEGKLVSVELN